jgi:hypothetical protein
LKGLRGGRAQAAGRTAFKPDAQFDLAAFQLAGQDFTQCGFGLPEFVWQSKGQV